METAIVIWLAVLTLVIIVWLILWVRNVVSLRQGLNSLRKAFDIHVETPESSRGLATQEQLDGLKGLFNARVDAIAHHLDIKLEMQPLARGSVPPWPMRAVPIERCSKCEQELDQP